MRRPDGRHWKKMDPRDTPQRAAPSGTRTGQSPYIVRIFGSEDFTEKIQKMNEKHKIILLTEMCTFQPNFHLFGIMSFTL